jgi:hypothetical protein
VREVIAPLKFRMPLWADRWAPDNLRERYFQITPRAFDRGFRQRPSSSMDLIFPHFAQNEIFFYSENWREIENELHPGYVDPSWPRFIGADLSGAKRRGNVVFVVALSPTGIRHVIDVWIGAWDSPEMARQIDASFREHKPKIIFVENNAYQQALIDWIVDAKLDCAHYVEGFHTGSKKMDPIIGLPSMDVQFSMKLWRIGIPHSEHDIVAEAPGVHGCACGPCTWVRDCRTTTFEDDTPDSIMASFIAKEASRMGGKWTPEAVEIVKATTHKAMERVRHGATTPYRIPAGQKSSTFQRRKSTDEWGRPLK